MISKSREQWEEELDDKIRRLGYKGKIPINLVHKKKLLDEERKKISAVKMGKRTRRDQSV